MRILTLLVLLSAGSAPAQEPAPRILALEWPQWTPAPTTPQIELPPLIHTLEGFQGRWVEESLLAFRDWHGRLPESCEDLRANSPLPLWPAWEGVPMVCTQVDTPYKSSGESGASLDWAFGDQTGSSFVPKRARRPVGEGMDLLFRVFGRAVDGMLVAAAALDEDPGLKQLETWESWGWDLTKTIPGCDISWLQVLSVNARGLDPKREAPGAPMAMCGGRVEQWVLFRTRPAMFSDEDDDLADAPLWTLPSLQRGTWLLEEVANDRRHDEIHLTRGWKAWHLGPRVGDSLFLTHLY